MWHPLSPSPCRMLWLSSVVWGVQCVTRGPYAEPQSGQLFGSWPSSPRLPGASLHLPQGGLTAHVRGHFLNVLHMSEATSSTYCTCEGPFSERIAHVRGHFLHVSEAIVSTYCTCQRPVPERTTHVNKESASRELVNKECLRASPHSELERARGARERRREGEGEGEREREGGGRELANKESALATCMPPGG